MSEVRESIARKVRSDPVPTLTNEESVDVLRMIDELGRHEAAAIKHGREKEEADLRAAVLRGENTGLRELLARERRSLWDTFAAAGLGSGKDVDTAASQAEQMMIRREGRRA